MNFAGYFNHGCDPQNLAGLIRTGRTYPSGTTQTYHMFRIPNAAGPGPYSFSVDGTLSGYELFCCMDADCIQCEPWKIGHNTEWGLVDVERPELALPTVTELHQNYPNPFNATTVVNYQLEEANHVTLEVYNLLGERVAVLADEMQEAGYKSVNWDASSLASGIYFYRMTAGRFERVKKMTLLK